MRTRAPPLGSRNAAISPAAYTPSATRIAASTERPPSFSRSTPATNSFAGRTPTPITTSAAGKRLSSSSTTAAARPAPSIRAGRASRWKRTPFASCSARNEPPIRSPNWRTNGTFSGATTETAICCSRRQEATSSPMKLLPRMTGGALPVAISAASKPNARPSPNVAVRRITSSRCSSAATRSMCCSAPSGAPGLLRLLWLIGRGNLVWPNLVERLLRDLATYLRQPAPDETLTEAAAWFTANDLPDLGPSGAHAGE